MRQHNLHLASCIHRDVRVVDAIPLVPNHDIRVITLDVNHGKRYYLS